ncbi:MAG: nickel pincer cofactor biosynthesis protein LarB [Clostridiales bacterium]|nr:nickel pincer cofactor biosynthesis protein LarB [Clostridiales bacterium]
MIASDKSDILELLTKVSLGDISPQDALAHLQLEPYADLGFANIDLHRGVRQGANEVIYGKGKSPEQIVDIVRAMRARGLANILITRIESDTAQILTNAQIDVDYHPIPKLGIAYKAQRASFGNVAVVSAGTSDMGVCEEAALTAENLGSRVTRVYDVGVAGLHRLLARLDVLRQARVIVAVAGMEGALASVVGGLVSCPVIAVPTSVGYGANFGGVSALLSMLNSCASGVAVVNIDNGFGAGFIAHSINRTGGPDK